MSSTSQTGGIASGGGTTYAPYTPTETYEFKLDKRGRVTLYWSTKSFQLCGLQLSCGSSDSGSFPAKMTLKSVAKTVDKGGEMYGLIVEGAPNKRWLLRAKDKESFAYAHHFLFNALCHHNAHEVENFGLPPIDPRVNLPFIDVPAMHVERFGLLGKAVLYVFDDVVEIAEVIEEEEEEDTEENHGNGSDAQGKIEKKSVENDTNKKGYASSVPEPILAEVSRVLILGDRCIYICTESSDIERCIRVLDIEMLFVTQNDEALGIRMIREPDGSILEPDLLLKCFDCKSFVPKLTAVYNFLRRDKEPLKIERGLDEDELLNNVLSLHIPDTWTLKLTLPTSRKNLAKTLEVMEENQRMIHNKSAIAAQNSTNACGTNLAPAPSVGMVMLPSLTVLPGANAEDICGEHANISDQEEENAGKSEAAVEAPLSDPLAMFLTKLNLCDAYYTKLRYQHVDWEVFRVFEYDDMACFGIYNEEHRTTLLKHSLDEDFVRVVEEESRAHQLRKRGALDPSLSKTTSATGVLRKKTTATSNKSNRARAVLFTGDDDESNTVGKMSSTSDKNLVTVSNVDMEDLDDDLEVDLGLGNRKKSAGLLPSLSFLDDLDDLGNGSPLRATLMKKKSFALDGDLFGSPRKKQSIRFSGLKKGSENASGPSASVDIDLDDILASPRLKKKVSMAQFHINKQKIIDLDNDDLLASPRAKGAGSMLVNLDDL